MPVLPALLLLAAASAAPCRTSEAGRALDFWLGDWRVASSDGGTVYGENHIEAALEGCAVLENWEGASGGEGKSLFAFDARGGIWEQVWVTSDTAHAGGLKHKKLTEFTGGRAVFEGELVSDKGAPYRDRTTLTKLDDGRVRQLIEISIDGGATWSPVFDGYYSRK